MSVGKYMGMCVKGKKHSGNKYAFIFYEDAVLNRVDSSKRLTQRLTIVSSCTTDYS